MQLESEELSHTAFARLRQIPEHLVSHDPFTVTNGYPGGIHESNARAFTGTDRFEKEQKRYRNPVFLLDKTIAGQSVRKLVFQVFPHIMNVTVFETVTTSEMKTP